jgi:hypothetical protein
LRHSLDRRRCARTRAITINPTLRPSAQRLQEIHDRLERLDAACVFAEPQFEPALVDTVIEVPAPKRACWIRSARSSILAQMWSRMRSKVGSATDQD